MHHNQPRNFNGNDGRNRGEHAAPSAGAQRGYDQYTRDERGHDNGRSYEDAREYNGGRADDGGFIGDRDFRGERDDRPVMASRYGYDDDRRFGPSGHEPQRFNHDTDDGRWGRDHDYNPDYHHHHSYTRGYDAAMRDIARRDPRRDDPRAGRSAFEAPFEQQRRRR